MKKLIAIITVAAASLAFAGNAPARREISEKELNSWNKAKLVACYLSLQNCCLQNEKTLAAAEKILENRKEQIECLKILYFYCYYQLKGSKPKMPPNLMKEYMDWMLKMRQK